MKNARALLLLLLAIVAGLGAAFFAAGWASQRGQVAVTKVVVAAADINSGSKLGPRMVEVMDWPVSALPAGTFQDPGQVTQRVVRTSLARGEPLLDRKLMPPGAQGGLSGVIAEGKRAMTVRVNDVVGVAGFALPGNYVDVMVHAQKDRAKGERPVPVSVTVLERVLVLAVAQEASRDATKPKVVNAVTLELAPGDAEKLDLARSVGSLSLVLRNQMDLDRTDTRGVTKDALFAMFRDAAPPAPPAPAIAPVRVPRAAPRPVAVIPVALPLQRDCVEVIRAGTRSTSCF
jgi:pilus assembly protein CpaB